MSGFNTYLNYFYSADYMICGHGQLCYVNINNQYNYVSRGCITKPAFNSFHYFCNTSKCNNVSYFYQKVIPTSDLTLFRTTPLTRRLVSGSSCNIFCGFTALVILQTFLFKQHILIK